MTRRGPRGIPGQAAYGSSPASVRSRAARRRAAGLFAQGADQAEELVAA
ncbi:hypothetical protein [Streptomyces sp. NPDC001389]